VRRSVARWSGASFPVKALVVDDTGSTSKDNPAASMTSSFLAIRVRHASRHISRDADRSLTGLLAAGRMATRS
jgi:hypothetical protein